MVFAQEQACGHPMGEKGQNDQLRLLIIMVDRFCQPSPTDCKLPLLTGDMNPFVDDGLENLLTYLGKILQNDCNLLTSHDSG